MFTIDQIRQAHAAVKSGADFPDYIRALKVMGVTSYQTWAKDSHTEYHGTNQYSIESKGMYEELIIAAETNKDQLVTQLKAHQAGHTDYLTFCKNCAANGIEKWVVDLKHMTCIYYDRQGNQVLVEEIPG